MSNKYSENERIETLRVSATARGYELVSESLASLKSKVVLNCPQHGPFPIVAENLLQGCGCKKCAALKIREERRRCQDMRFQQDCACRGLTLVGPYVDGKTEVDVACVGYGHKDSVKPTNLKRSKSVPYCRLCRRKLKPEMRTG